MASDFLDLCELPVKDGERQLTVSKHVPRLHKLVPCKLIVPLQESLVVSLPPTSALRVAHQPFPHNAPTISGLSDHHVLVSTFLLCLRIRGGHRNHEIPHEA